MAQVLLRWHLSTSVRQVVLVHLYFRFEVLHHLRGFSDFKKRASVYRHNVLHQSRQLARHVDRLWSLYLSKRLALIQGHRNLIWAIRLRFSRLVLVIRAVGEPPVQRLWHFKTFHILRSEAEFYFLSYAANKADGLYFVINTVTLQHICPAAHTKFITLKLVTLPSRA